MTPERWHQIEQLCGEALDRDPGERGSFLEQACAGDEDLRSEVESLLAQEKNVKDFLKEPAMHEAVNQLRENAGNRDHTKTLVGRSIGHYQVLSFVAAGGMGEVYRARHARLDRDVALKVLPGHVSPDPEQVRRSEREAKLLASLNHPNIAAIYDFVEFDGIQCLVLEYVEGQTLVEQLKRGRLTSAEALEIARQIAEALECAHEKGIIHRDLKPGNVMITAEGKVKVLDFGIAKILESETLPDSSPTASSVTKGVVLGTPAYMAPEQAKAQPANRTSDIWAFGCVLYEMLSGQRAFHGDSPAEILGRVLETEPDWSALPAEMLPGIRKLVQRCLRKDPRSRLQNIGDARIEIEEARSETDTAEPSPRPTAVRGRLAWVSALAVVAVVSVVIAVLAFRPQQPAPEMRLEIAAPPTMAPWSLAISPDGQKIVFSAIVANQTRLWLRLLDSPSARQLAGTDNADFPFWSSDSRSVAFFADGKLKRIDIDGGTPQVLADAPLGRGTGTWSRSGVILFTPNNSGPIFRVSAAGGEAQPVTTMEVQGGSHRYPRFLPDGRHFLYFSGDGISYTALDGSEKRQIIERIEIASPAGYTPTTGHLMFQRGTTVFSQRFDPDHGTLIGDPSPVADHVPPGAWSVSETGPIIYRTRAVSSAAEWQLVWFDRSGKALEQASDRMVYSNLGMSLSRDGRQIAFEGIGNGDRHSIWLLDLGRRALSRLTDLATVTFPVWSPDGSRIVFGHFEPNSSMDLYQRATNGLGTEELLLHTPLNKAATDWSPDARFVLYRSPDPKTSMDLWALPMDGSRKSFPVVRTQADERDGQFSPDGKWIAYQSNESGRFEIYVQPFPGPGRKKPISTSGGAQVRWRRDGRELFYIALDGKLMSVPITLTTDGKAIEPGAAVPLFPTNVGGAVQFDRQQYFVSLDGQRFLMNTVAEVATTSPITVILNYKPKS